MLRRMDCAKRAAQPCIGSERADLVVSGCAVLEAICKRWPVGRLKVADRGIREGILCELMRGGTGRLPANVNANANAPDDAGK
jgi:exopolyphosphatase/guanosine-5'-triphosphate,3'-diphosphate pyrophosphatase